MRDVPTRAAAGITVTPLSPACGAEIGGVGLTRELSPAVVQAIKQAWAEHLVLVFRGQDVTQEQQLRFAFACSPGTSAAIFPDSRRWSCRTCRGVPA